MQAQRREWCHRYLGGWLGQTMMGIVGAVILFGRSGVVVEASVDTVASSRALELDQIFLFLFMALGPFNVIAPFAAMTRERDAGYKRQLAVQGGTVAALALVIAATLGARILRGWEVSTPSLVLTGGVILFVIALRRVLLEYAPFTARVSVAVEGPSPAIFPLAFPTIVTPFGIAVLMISLRLRPGNVAVLEILALVAAVLVLDLIAMLCAERILSTPSMSSAFQIMGAVMVVLQVALSIELLLYGLRLVAIA